MVNPRRKVLAFLLACMMVLSLLPMSAFAAATAATDGIAMDVAEGMEPGSRCPDFTFTTYDGKTYNLYDTLAEKDMVLINLWATWCGPCQQEFPALTQAYEAYKDKVEVFALSVEPTDTNDVLAQYVAAMGMTFPVGMDTPDLGTYFQVMYIPTSIVVDRHGIICFVENGSQTNPVKFATLFDTFIGDDYSEPEILDGFPGVKPTVPSEDASALAAALGTGSNITVSNGTEETDWPFTMVSADGRTYLQSSNAGMDESQAVLNATVTAKDGDVLSLDYSVSSEYGYDFLEISVDGQVVKLYSGTLNWDTFAYALSAGTHEITIAFVKDQMSAEGTDVACIDNLKILSGAAAQEALAAMPQYPHSDRTSMKVINEDAKAVMANDPLGIGEENFYSVPTYVIVNGTTATFEITLEEGIDPDAITIYSEYGGTTTLLTDCFVQESEDDPGKFIYESYVDTIELTQTFYTPVTLYNGQTGDQICFILFADEACMNAFDEFVDSAYADYMEDAISFDEVPGSIDVTIPEGYELGKRMPNFTFTDINGVEHDLYETLAEKDMVLINIWATWCGPCQLEFPYMEESYEKNKENIEIFALSCEPTDDVDALKKYAANMKMTFPVGSDVLENGGPDLATAFYVEGIPTSIAVDRYGMICLIEAGSQDATAKFDQLFDTLTDDDYTPTVLPNGFPGPKYTEERADSAALTKAAVAPGSKIELKNSVEITDWPFKVSEDGTCIISMNSTPTVVAPAADEKDAPLDTSNTTAFVTFDVETRDGDVLTLDYKLDSQFGYDMFVVYVDGKAVKSLSGDWGEDFHTLAIQLTAGKHEIKLAYEKDYYASTGDDCVAIKNIKISSGASAYNALQKLTKYPLSKENSVKLATDAKQLNVTDNEEGDLAYFLDYNGLNPSGYYIVDGNKYTLDITLAKGFDPETATVTNLNTNDMVVLAPYAKEDRYSIEVDVDSLATTGSPYSCYLVEATNADGDYYSACVIVFADETNADLFCLNNSYGSEETITWTYARKAPAEYSKNALEVGDKVKAFEYEDTKGVKHSLTDILKTKKGIFLYYGPMNTNTLEFYTELQKSYDKYKDQIEFIAYSTNENDDAAKLDAFAAANKLTFPIVAGKAEELYKLGAAYIPYLLFVDKNGMVVYVTDADNANYPVPEVLLNAFCDYLVDEDYTFGAVDGFPGTKYTGEQPNPTDLAKAAGCDKDKVTIAKNASSYEWPFTVATSEDGTTYLTTSNTGKDNTKAVLTVDFTSVAGDVLKFDYKVSCEASALFYVFDYLTIDMDGQTLVTGYDEIDWTTFVWDLDAGKHTLTFTYVKDYTDAAGDDMAGVRNLRVLTGDEAVKFIETRPKYPFADETSVSVEGAVKLNISDPDDLLYQIFYEVPEIYIATDDEVTFNINIAKGKQPEHISVLDEDSYEYYALSDLVSEDGSCYTITVNGKDLYYGYGGIEVMDDITGEEYAFCLLFPDEAAAKEFIDGYMAYLPEGTENTITWTYEGDVAPTPDDGNDEPTPEREPAPEGTYVVRFVDEEGNPVEGVRVQACNGDLCTIKYSDANGEISVPVADDAHFSVASCPDGLTADTDDHLYDEGYVTIFVLHNA